MGEVVLQNIPPEDDITFNLFAEDLVHEWDLKIENLRAALTRGGQQIDQNTRTTYVDPVNPVIRLNIGAICEDYGYNYSTSLLVYKPNVYSYSFFANGQWYQSADVPYVLPGAINGGFNPAYSAYQKDMPDIGPGKIFSAVMTLYSRVDSIKFKDLCFIFLESARLPKICDHVRRSFDQVVGTGVLYDRTSMNIPFPKNVREIHKYWGQISSAALSIHNQENPPQKV